MSKRTYYAVVIAGHDVIYVGTKRVAIRDCCLGLSSEVKREVKTIRAETREQAANLLEEKLRRDRNAGT